MEASSGNTSPRSAPKRSSISARSGRAPSPLHSPAEPLPAKLPAPGRLAEPRRTGVIPKLISGGPFAAQVLSRAFAVGDGRAFLAFAFGALEQRVAFELGFDIGDEIEARKLQQLDGLQKLRRHHQGLALAHFKPM